MELAHAEIQEFIRQHENDDEKQLVLSHREILGIPSGKIAEQIIGRRKAKSKLPEYYNTSGIIYPPGVNLEQSSSSQTASLKADLLRQQTSHHNTLIDLTGGFGVDSYFFSQSFHEVMYVEPNASLLEVARHNHRLLKADYISHHVNDAESFIRAFQGEADCIYIDPSRRKGVSTKVFKLSDCEPDVIALKDLILTKTDCIMIKASPLLDIQQGLRELTHVEEVFVIAVDNECKEVLFLLNKKQEGEPTITAINIRHGQQQQFRFLFSEESDAIATFSPVLQYLYEPNAAILKAGAFKILSPHFSIEKLHANTHLYTSATLLHDFPGRIFEIESILPSETKVIQNSFTDQKANIITRNYPLTPDELKKKFRLNDGGEQYLLGFTAQEGKHLCKARRLK